MSRLLAILATFATSLVVVASAVAHADVTQRSPRPGATMSNGPRSVIVTFNQQLRSGATIIVKRGRRVVLRGRNDPRNVKRIRASRSSRLPNGVYRVTWRATGPDGHVLRGSWSFRVR